GGRCVYSKVLAPIVWVARPRMQGGGGRACPTAPHGRACSRVSHEPRLAEPWTTFPRDASKYHIPPHYVVAATRGRKVDRLARWRDQNADRRRAPISASQQWVSPRSSPHRTSSRVGRQRGTLRPFSNGPPPN